MRHAQYIRLGRTLRWCGYHCTTDNTRYRDQLRPFVRGSAVARFSYLPGRELGLPAT